MTASTASRSSRPGHSLGRLDTVLPVAIPSGYVGPVALPGTGRMIWWTGRVAIGLRNQTAQRCESARWLQDMLLADRSR
jgi:hypothetical protein